MFAVCAMKTVLPASKDREKLSHRRLDPKGKGASVVHCGAASGSGNATAAVPRERRGHPSQSFFDFEIKMKCHQN